MADSIGTIERQNCWLTMSDLFVDNEVDYGGIADSLVQHCPNMTDAELKRTYFDEVAPVLGGNGLSPAPAVWTGFDGDQVLRDISGWLAQQQSSAYYRATGCVWRAMCRLLFKSIWSELERELLASRQTR